MNYQIKYSGIAYRRLKHSLQLRAMMKRRERLALPFSGKRPTTGTGKSGKEVAR